MIYKAVMLKIREMINSSKFTVGDCLPSEKILAEKFRVSRMTIRKAIDELIKIHLLERKQGSGTYIIDKDFYQHKYGLNSFTEYLKVTQKSYHTDVIHFEIMIAPLSIAQKLKCTGNEQVYYIRRVRYIDNQPVLVEDSYMPVALYPDLSIQYLTGSKYQYIEEVRKYHITGHKVTICPIIADSDVATLLHLPKDSLLLQERAITYSNENKILDLSIIMYHTDRYKMSFYFPRNKVNHSFNDAR